MSENEITTRRDRLEGLLPFYLNGTLEGEELREVEEWLASDPEGAAALMEAEAEYSGTAAANESIRPPADALARFSESLEREAGPDRSTRPSLMARLLGSFGGIGALSTRVAWATAAVAVAVLVVQTVAINVGGPDRYSVAGAGDESLPFVLVTFREDATIAEITTSLAESGLEVDAGPLPGAMYRVLVPVKTVAAYDRLTAALRDEPFVDVVIDGRKPDNDAAEE